MKLFASTFKTSAIALVAASSSLVAAENSQAPYLSLKLEMEHAITKGNQYLKSTQDEKGFWKNDKIPAYTALALTAARRSPNEDDASAPHVKKGYEWLIAQQHKDGGIYVKGLATYNTSTSLMALSASGDPAHKENILSARRFLINLQQDWDIKGETDNPNDGGIGYGGSYPHSDMSNTYLAIEALKLSEAYAKDSAKRQPELNWDAAIQFISRTQNLEETNDQEGISNDGSFVYFPGNSKAGTQKDKDGRETLRGYGSMSYAGLLSFIYADLDEDDVRVKAVKQWLNDNYTLEENPGLGEQGLFYYYHVMAKALTAAGIDTLKTKDGSEHDWRKALATRVLTSQQKDGSWVNENARWWENEPELVTSYAVLTLEQIYHSIPQPLKGK
ncbi:prenyltransferase/squalene oxidase repeat-containing protein [Rubritalea tangerina]|uniref:Prenyltransferase/squalene oxidase repeat-containing protein n=1 Tax=Rubritalea tangerina TaxID=430798 RepID=A0ABW4Z736_9BACT